MTYLLDKWRKAHVRLPTSKCMLKRSHHSVHTLYFLAVFMEGHGLYAITGGTLFGMSILNFFIHFDMPDVE